MVGLGLLVAASACGSSHHSTTPVVTSPSTSVPSGGTPSETAGFHTQGNELMGPTGQLYVPDGFVLFCLAEQTLACMQQSPTDLQKIQASASYWHADAVRLQVAQEHLFDQSPYDAAYLNDIDQEVNLAHSLGMGVILSLQEEMYGGPPMPTETAVKFWTFMAAHFKDTGVIFDLYNEPRLPAYQGDSWLWNIWQNGGQVDTNGVDDTFVGMQTLVNTVRATGAANVVLAEGVDSDHNLSELSSHYLTGSNIAYGIDPDLKTNVDTPADWAAAYGDLASTVPIIMDEFHDYPTAGACFSSSPTVLPQELSYLQSKHLGLLAWTMAAGNMIVGDNLDQPTSYQGTDTQLCVAHNQAHQAVGDDSTYQPTSTTNGPGADVLNFFKATSTPVPASSLTGS
jgi:hypothetical protein